MLGIQCLMPITHKAADGLIVTIIAGGRRVTIPTSAGGLLKE